MSDQPGATDGPAIEDEPMKILKWLLVGVVFCCGGIALQMVMDDEDRDAILAWINGQGEADELD